MVPETEFSSAITRPLDVIQSIFQSHQNPSSPSSSSFTASVESHFADLFKDVDARQNIPNLTPSSLPRLLSDESLRSHPSGRLVRWRCMIQDTGLGTELFLRSTSASSSDGDDHTNSLRSNFYGAESRTVASTSDRSSLEQDDQVDPSNLAERSVVYAVSIPGQTRWANEFLGESVSNHLPSPSHSSSAVVGSHCEVESLSRSLGDLSLSSLLDTRGAAEKIEVVRQRISKAVEKARSIGGGRVSGRRRGPGGMGEGEEAGKGEGRGPRLVAISKLHPPSSILACHLGSGQIHFGENYVQEMVDKAKVLPKELKWHFVGGLQSNKGKLLATIPNLYLLETLDSIKAANVLEKALASPDAAKRSEPLRVYLQVNTSGEESKSGLAPLLEEEKEGVAEAKGPLLELAKHVIAKCPHIRFRGLMTIGSAANSTSVDASGEEFKDVGSVVSANPDFERLILSRKRLVSALRKDVQVREQAKRLDDADYETLFSDQEDETGGLELSMGMSSDLEVATMAGSDNVRVGTDCFGKRPPTRDLAMAGMKDELELGIEAALSKRNAEEAGGRKEEEGRALEGRTANLPSSPTSTFKDPYPQKAPIPEEEHVGGLIKIYDVEKAERLKTTQIVEVVGVLDTSSLPNADWQDLGSSSSSSPGQANRQAPCVHAILLEPEPETTFLPGLIEPGDQDSIKQTWNSRCREKLVKYLSSALGGDRLAAEYTLLALIARM
ncbi:hypothetical protein IE53DRAFT_385954 [Violaceomyces palustris]|uniref:Uncharacterized protein n=1 Tax=Violaceomyces palustris TaxID=1673888 RepID=A0ACD0P0T4_9BASI|nr:hypothetical protein IE53DRAFT_385954 [Violaceomyces palustris]